MQVPEHLVADDHAYLQTVITLDHSGARSRSEATTDRSKPWNFNLKVSAILLMVPYRLFTVEVHSGLGLTLMKSVMTVNLDKRF